MGFSTFTMSVFTLVRESRMKTLEHKDLQLHYSLPSKDRLKDRLTEWRGVVVQYKRRAQSRADQCLYLRL